MLFCGYCERRMQGDWNNQQAYYRCRFPAQYAIVNQLDHPKVVYLREAEILDEVDGWLGSAFVLRQGDDEKSGDEEMSHAAGEHGAVNRCIWTTRHMPSFSLEKAATM